MYTINLTVHGCAPVANTPRVHIFGPGDHHGAPLMSGFNLAQAVNIGTLEHVPACREI